MKINVLLYGTHGRREPLFTVEMPVVPQVGARFVHNDSNCNVCAYEVLLVDFVTQAEVRSDAHIDRWSPLIETKLYEINVIVQRSP